MSPGESEDEPEEPELRRWTDPESDAPSGMRELLLHFRDPAPRPEAQRAAMSARFAAAVAAEDAKDAAATGAAVAPVAVVIALPVARRPTRRRPSVSVLWAFAAVLALAGVVGVLRFTLLPNGDMTAIWRWALGKPKYSFGMWDPTAKPSAPPPPSSAPSSPPSGELPPTPPPP